MALRSQDLPAAGTQDSIDNRYRSVRTTSLALCRTLEPEDYVVQSMPSVSPTKWHLAHTSWFFEQFILVDRLPEYEVFEEQYEYLFNSYYYTKGQMHPRDERGLLSRPTVREIVDYREHVDEAMLSLLARSDDSELHRLVELGLNHEQQHQELMLTDIKNVFSINPLRPALLHADFYRRLTPVPDLNYVEMDGGTIEVGNDGSGFCFDNETPRHEVLLRPYRIADRLVTNAEYLAFMRSGAYEDSSLWLADGWAWLQETGSERPLYWSRDNEREFTLSGIVEIEPDAPVCHVSFYEADAFARWAGARLPSETEWEHAAADIPVAGNLLEQGLLHPQPLKTRGGKIAQVYGDAWEWTASPYSPYPGFKPLGGSLGEYNAKFMCNQLVCRGGSCVTPPGHVRASYRNFFYPQERWQFFGIRLAKDV